MEQNTTVEPKVVQVFRRDIARTNQPLPVMELNDALLEKLGRS